MAEEYREYRRRRAAAENPKKKGSFSKKLGYQTIISLALLIAVCAFRFAAEESIINTYIENAVFYKPDTSEITHMLGSILNYDTEEGSNNEENNNPENL